MAPVNSLVFWLLPLPLLSLAEVAPRRWRGRRSWGDAGQGGHAGAELPVLLSSLVLVCVADTARRC
jgi:hypothetical protein